LAGNVEQIGRRGMRIILVWKARKEGHQEDLNIDGRIILRFSLEK
jgi:hypothetical protein